MEDREYNLVSRVAELERKVSKLEKEIKLMKDGICPKCQSVIHDQDNICWKCATESNK